MNWRRKKFDLTDEVIKFVGTNCEKLVSVQKTPKTSHGKLVFVKFIHNPSHFELLGEVEPHQMLKIKMTNIITVIIIFMTKTRPATTFIS